MTPAYLFDIDGTLSDCSHRLRYIREIPKDWDRFFASCKEDAPIKHMCNLVNTLYDADKSIVYITGRPALWRSATMDWLATNLLPEAPLFMRNNGDHRDDDIVKCELVDAIIAGGYRPIMAFEDRSRVVKAFRARGIPTAQVAEGDF